jgi:hypothetical protein
MSHTAAFSFYAKYIRSRGGLYCYEMGLRAANPQLFFMQINFLSILAAGVILLIVLVCVCFVANRPQLITIDAEIPENFPAVGFGHNSFENLLRKYVDADGYVDFDRWHQSAADRSLLDSYLAAVGSFSPEAAPDRFPKKSDELAFWMYGYNGYVIKSVLDHWPIESVTDIKAPIEAVKGLGFFYRQRFYFGGKPLSLYAVENEKIRKAFHDPRIHFVLYCASGSCPVLRPELPTGEELELLLQEATVVFVSDQRNVRVDHERRQIVLSAIFDMYRSDFIRELTKRGVPSDGGVIDYVTFVAPDYLQEKLTKAIDYDIVFADYDWSIARSK